MFSRQPCECEFGLTQVFVEGGTADREEVAGLVGRVVMEVVECVCDCGAGDWWQFVRWGVQFGVAEVPYSGIDEGVRQSPPPP